MTNDELKRVFDSFTIYDTDHTVDSIVYPNTHITKDAVTRIVPDMHLPTGGTMTMSPYYLKWEDFDFDEGWFKRKFRGGIDD